MGVHIRDMDNPAAAQLRVAVKQAWVALRPVRGLALVRSMPRPVRAVLAAYGGHTNYQPTLYDAIDPF